MACLEEVSDVSTHAWPVEQLHYFHFVLLEPECPAIGVELARVMVVSWRSFGSTI